MVGAQRCGLATGAVFGGLGVALGAFAAHGLKQRLTPEMLAIFEVGVRYQMYHALALVAVAMGSAGLWRMRCTWWACIMWTTGVLIFSGSLYALALTGIRWLGAITPFGGVAFLIGWSLLLAAAMRAASPQE
ncbi:MAG: DUF423 domain-containing protein [Candidatus Hydrogenedentes bacterium]|nr:DUF423 domain-containing protein [Candidatus Hydrogenedentota bacterium]